ncbi:MAG: ADP-ribosylglycohydrolase family protein [Candidatus Nanoarchaeia archaeon]
MRLTKEERIKGCIYGLATGDALGATLEFLDEDKIKEYYGDNGLRDIIGGGWLRLYPGEYTDDTQLMKCLASSLIEKQKFDPGDIALKYVAWKNTNPKDIGSTTLKAIENLENGAHPSASGINKPSNGSLMRTSPIALVSKRNKIPIYSSLDSCITHSHGHCMDICAINNLIIHDLINSGDELEYVTNNILKERNYRCYDSILRIGRVPTKPSGYVIETFQAVLYSLMMNKDFESTIITAINLGGDSDTVGAITGAIAGAAYGIESIPKRWIERIKDYEERQIEKSKGKFTTLESISKEIIRLRNKKQI